MSSCSTIVALLANIFPLELILPEAVIFPVSVNPPTAVLADISAPMNFPLALILLNVTIDPLVNKLPLVEIVKAFEFEDLSPTVIS